MNKKFLAIIPARGGSKRLLNKNIIELAGKPLISWTLDEALKSKYLDDIVVSTDDKKIRDVVEKYSSIKIIDRPKELSTDTANTFDALEHTINSIEEKYDYIVLLQVTSPLRKSFHIDEAIEFLISKNADSVVSVSKTEHSPLWCNTLPKDLCMKNFLKDEVKNKRSQDLETYYQLNGAIYICKVDKLLKEKTFFLEDNIFAYLMEKKYSIDIDEEVDLKIADVFLNYYK